MVGTDRRVVHPFAAPAQIGCQFIVRSREMLTEGNGGNEDFNLENVFVVFFCVEFPCGGAIARFLQRQNFSEIPACHARNEA
jgi:hypothetical protein